mmetsp:Transcript_94/g.311  ORF Transcript_94/g.311 Transcript_94/m.311 type:complete len:930 (+) Transcript_94:104-2893(+)|eukprot:CAMPEP_0117657156 /NCGR_PEP_ID=MMETSP0804-20121206/5183_1 /TAXON_ID=1074897 /ORGANISM="Tetraselmis astigmatica, Strain CCMP880" /LENGTH=929 /DNA_ID=CAMNT_0005463597 /DNA_START=61 /DNA_END=2850 /DNA_ORIENTATION=+
MNSLSASQRAGGARAGVVASPVGVGRPRAVISPPVAAPSKARLASARDGLLKPGRRVFLGRQAPRQAPVVAQAAAGTEEVKVEVKGCPRGAEWVVHKFGGTCVATPDRIRDAARLMVESQGEGSRTMVVVSAIGSHVTSPVKTTDLLINMVSKAAAQDGGFLLDLEAIREKHIKTATALLPEGPDLNGFVAKLSEDMNNLKAMLQAISIAGIATQTFSDFVVGHGEIWSAHLFAAVCRQLGGDAVWLDTRDVLVVEATEDGTAVDADYPLCNTKMDEWVTKQGGIPKLVIATGFIARDHTGRATTLRRNGSDYSATIMGALLQAKNITIWTDVDGVYSADPRKVPEAVCLDTLTYHEAWELAYFGANVLHPRTTQPAMKYDIPITLRNFFNLSAPGTVIHSQASPKSTITGFATIDHCALINVEGTGMVGVPGIASSIFSTVRDAGINVIMISQASSEHSVCFAVKGADGAKAAEVLREKFKDVIAMGGISKVEVILDCAVLAAVGVGMASRRGTAAEMFSALAADNINIRAIAQGCSEYNITVIIEQNDCTRALKAVHGRFYLSDVPIAVGIVGPGQIGSTLMKQISEQVKTLHETLGVDLRVVAISSSKKMLLDERGIDLKNWKEAFEASTTKADLVEFGAFLNRTYIPNSVIVDTTASDAVSDMYDKWLASGIHVCTANKKLSSGPLDRYRSVKTAQRNSTYTHFFYEAAVGAGLPVLSTLKDLRLTGDKINTIEGIFSGTLSYIFNTWPNEVSSFSECVLQARAAGFTEPDPRDDLNGLDVARKVTTLARECGLMVELEDVPVDNLVPEALRETDSVDAYLEALPEYDAEMAAKAEEAAAQGEVLRYVGVIDLKAGKCAVELRRYPKSHAFATLSGSDNIMLFSTARYNQQPLIVRGPGAGAEVTAGGVFGDVLRLAAHLGSPSN